ncbi:diguanylate cyclase domain-containing protein [Pararhodospirillum photometricum]|uniref:diguanylate cyclase domain-containing protein n=1 Tax=Pararhodospirillum photometricum TaxID=1084 RepID=UPI0002E28D54|nr:diguanylate cyclase [Pararhodospirillum photometricum]
MCVDPDWVPFERLNERNEHEGIAADLLALAVQRAGLTLQVIPTRDWAESLQASREGRCQILSFLNQTPERERWLIFTRPLLEDPNVLITREEHALIEDPGSLNESIVFPEGTAMEERIRAQYPNLRVIVTKTEEQTLAMVSDRLADMTLRSLIVAAHTIKEKGFFNLKIAAILPGYRNQLRVGVRQDLPVLRDLLDHGIATITREERDRIVNTHVPLKVEAPPSHGLLLGVTAVLVLTLGGTAVGVYQLRQRNRMLERLARTDSLTNLPNRIALNHALEHEIARARRQGQPLSVLMIDIDHFKRVNDQHGHLMGDDVLVATARAIAATLRSSDLLGRWGGEEFLVLCPGTDGEGARHGAERICDAQRRTLFATGERHTLSVGIATLGPDDTSQTLFRRADQALYAAKTGGRDRVGPLLPS